MADEIVVRTRPEIGRILLAVNKKKPAPADLAAFRALLATDPEAWKVAGDLVGQVERALIARLSGTPLLEESIEHGVALLRRDFGSATAPVLERLLIEQIVLCYLQLHDTHGRYLGVLAQNPSLKALAYWEQRLTATQGRYLRAIETLARVRRLAKVTPLQVNIGAQQVNVAGVSVPDAV